MQPADLSDSDLERHLVELALELGSRLERWLGLVAELEARGVPRAAGFRSTAEWLAWRCGIDPRTAREHARVARALTRQPLVRAAMAAGTLSYSKVRAITRGCGAGVEEQELLALAERCTAAEVERAVRSLRSAPSADLAVANQAHERRYVDWWWEPDGSLGIHGRLTADDGAAVIEAIEAAAESVHPTAAGPGGSRRPALGARRADALVEIAQSGAPRAQVVLHVDRAALACTAEGPDRDGDVCTLEDGPAVPSETARRLACDAEIVGEHGRRRRVVSPALRTSLERRDHGCRFPGCTRRHGTHAHHVRHWAHGGATDRDNLVLLCRFHHRLVHEAGFEIRREAGALHFVHPDGHVIEPVPPVATERPAQRGERAAPPRPLTDLPVMRYDEPADPMIIDAVAMVA